MFPDNREIVKATVCSVVSEIAPGKFALFIQNMASFGRIYGAVC